MVILRQAAAQVAVQVPPVEGSRPVPLHEPEVRRASSRVTLPDAHHRPPKVIDTVLVRLGGNVSEHLLVGNLLVAGVAVPCQGI
eukprot:15654784-Heterocapsa_arctica.AAC.1